jgi:hypothetical protein
MAKAKKKKAGAASAAAPPGSEDPEERDIALTKKAIEPVLAAGLSHFKLASAAGAHPDDMKGFLEGRVSLTFALRERLRAAAPGLLETKEGLPGQ